MKILGSVWVGKATLTPSGYILKEILEIWVLSGMRVAWQKVPVNFLAKA